MVHSVCASGYNSVVAMAVDMNGSLHDRWQWPIEQGREYIAMIWFRPDAAQLTLHVLYMMNYSVVLDDICLIFNQ